MKLEVYMWSEKGVDDNGYGCGTVERIVWYVVMLL